MALRLLLWYVMFMFWLSEHFMVFNYLLNSDFNAICLHWFVYRVSWICFLLFNGGVGSPAIRGNGFLNHHIKWGTL